MNSNEELIEHLKENTGVLKSARIEAAFREIDRADFVDEDYKVEAYEDYPLPIGAGQTISQPTTVAYMLEELKAGEGMKVLDIGTGSGWTTALLSHIVGAGGQVYGFEIVPELVRAGQKNLEKYKSPQSYISQAKEGAVGFPSEAPYDRILVSAAFEGDVPQVLVDQLSSPGILVAPLEDRIVKIVKDEEGNLERKELAGFAFVPYSYE